MGDIADIVRSSLERHNLSVCTMDFPQNVHRDRFGYQRLLMKTVERLHPALVIPVGDSLSLAGYKPSLPYGTKAAVESPEKILLLSGKVSFSRLASEMGIRQPKFYSSVEETGLPTAREAAGRDPDEGVQIIFKRDISFGGHGVHRPRSLEALQQLIGHQSPGEPYLIEEYVPGIDWSVDAIRFDGYFNASSYKVLQTRGNGPSTIREVGHFPELESTARALMDKLDYHGLCGFDFRVREDGTPFILECNPRLTGGISSQIAAGFDIPLILFEHKDCF